MNKQELQSRTKRFHISVLRLCTEMPHTPAGYETAKQLIRSAGAVGANYRAALRAKSTADFIYKITVVLEEADESHYWLEIVKEAELLNHTQSLDGLIDEADQLTAIFAATAKTAKINAKQ